MLIAECEQQNRGFLSAGEISKFDRRLVATGGLLRER
jgi:hypothetical protein